jgi:uncharacterized protein YdeI (YjbR/CyaY-like superfamily)
MMRDPRIDDYLARQAPFARPILETIRAAVHEACPDAEETIKWGMPHFTHGGAILAGMAAFKAHATFGFWRGLDVVGEKQDRESAMGQFGRLTSVSDLPDHETLLSLIRKAAALIDGGAARPARKTPGKREFEVPAELTSALEGSPAAKATFADFPPSCRREYAEWVAEAKRPETRAKRVAQAVEWLAEGKRRNWKYEKC